MGWLKARRAQTSLRSLRKLDCDAPLGLPEGRNARWDYGIAGRKLTIACVLVAAALALHLSFILPFVLALLIHGA